MKPAITAIKGTKDILPEEVRFWQKVEATCRLVFEAYGYREIRTPVIEPTELFIKGTGETTDIVTKEMYTFTDKGGRSVTLRPEYTPSVVRAIIEHRLYLQPSPLRFYYFGPMFRHDRPQKGRYRQFHQADIEVFGEADPALDAEILEMADYLLRCLGVDNATPLINSVGCPVCRPNYVAALRKEAEKIRPLLCEDCQRRAELNPLRLFDCKLPGCQEQVERLPLVTDFLCPECRDHFSAFQKWLDFYGVKYRVEPRLVRGLDYYTRTTFEVVCSGLGAQNAILGGGRYDHLMKLYGGPDICGIGFAMGIERLLAVSRLTLEEEPLIYLACLGEKAREIGLRLCRQWRHLGVQALLEYKEKNLKGWLGRANKIKATWTVVLGEEEISRKECLLKDMRTGSQRQVSLDEIIGVVKELVKEARRRQNSGSPEAKP
ncbi:MAG: histidine--tRNA ligase [Candidatus Aminicenantales bacterium]